ncbi:cysteine desulfurase [Saprolegnia parasitica CBS 223.65]|uniref:Cysteine desulfurase n=1 Tax=Saprolegnia parasitica (strain CBS 223.65) TaxID=695850 RepID=A0A067CUD5_SAPPC|nr:cysteine desulfurase [Saprolegnia parasitica CBS 223.65]KDO34304.1 cysteine desulfurase [Saprolegnia parasitica CBS 223.65]|eukprot:XP_012195313.1 cysteine desulfurase [Saprolegnia parasitica CBS 223.65]
MPATPPMSPLTATEMAAVRAEFPSFGVPNQSIFFDNAGGGQVLKRVADKVYEYLTSTSVQIGGTYATAKAANARVLSARKAIAEFINAPNDDEVIMGSSTTSLMFLFIQALLPSIREGDEIILTNSEHEANVGAWKRLAKAGAVIKVWEINPVSMHLELAQLDALLTSKTKWVAMTHASNILGTVNPVKAVADRVHAVGGRLSVDAVAYAPHRLVDVQASGADIYVFSFYKVFGPHYAVMWGHRDFLVSLSSLNHEFIAADDLPYKLQPGNVNFELSHGCSAIPEYFQAMGKLLGAPNDASNRALMQHAFDRFDMHERYLSERLLAYLRSQPKVKVLGLAEVAMTSPTDHLYRERIATISFVVDGVTSPSIVAHMDRVNIGVRFGNFYAVHLVGPLGLAKHGGAVRVSMAHYNTVEEVDLLISHLRPLIV